MRKAIIALILAGLLTLATVATAFAGHDDPVTASGNSQDNVAEAANAAGEAAGDLGADHADDHQGP